MLMVSQFSGCTNTLVERLTQAVRDTGAGKRLSISLEGIDFLSLPELTALLSAVQSAHRRGIATEVSDLSPTLEALLELAGVSLH